MSGGKLDVGADERREEEVADSALGVESGGAADGYDAADGSGENVGTAAEESQKPVKKLNVVALVGLILSSLGAAVGLFYALVSKANALTYVYLPCLALGVIVSIVGAVMHKKFRSGLVMSIIGIIIGVIGLVASAIPLIILILILTSLGKG